MTTNLTRGTKSYYEFWEKKAKVISDLTGLSLAGFDPDILFNGTESHEVIQLPLWFVELIEKGLEERK